MTRRSCTARTRYWKVLANRILSARSPSRKARKANCTVIVTTLSAASTDRRIFQTVEPLLEGKAFS